MNTRTLYLKPFEAMKIIKFAIREGLTLVAESCFPSRNTELAPFGEDDDATVNWVEITREEWMKNFSE